MQFKWRKWNRAIHRDLGYIFFFTTIIYALSGIAINHRNDWNPNYRVLTYEKQMQEAISSEKWTKDEIRTLIQNLDDELIYRSHYYPKKNTLKVFVKDGNVIIDTITGEVLVELTKRRPILAPMNYLHYNPIKWWTWFSDAYAVGLTLLAISGLFILKGKNGITNRGAWLTGIGILIPVVFLIIYFY